jgi:hypothetical protein
MSREANGPHKIWDLDLQEDKTGASNYWRMHDNRASRGKLSISSSCLILI